MALQNPNFSPFLLFMAAVLQLAITICNAATLPTIGHSGATLPTMTTARPPPSSCATSNFQLPESKPDSHVVLHPLQPMQLDALTISFTAKMKKATAMPTVVSYAVRRRPRLSLELPGSDLKTPAGYYIFVAGSYCGQAHAAFPLDVWTQVTATWNGKTGEYAIYVNGKAVVGPMQDDDCKRSIRSGGTFILGGQKQQRSKQLSSDSRFIGSVINMQMWPTIFNASQLQSLWEGEGDFSHPGSQILDHPPTYGAELKSSARCDKECQPGQYEIKHGSIEIQCSDCPAGEFSTELGSLSCMACTPGMYSASAGSQNCSICDAGMYSSSSGSQNCTYCKPGMYASFPESQNCSNCAPGTYSPSEGSEMCTSCPIGYYQKKSGQAVCKICAPGEISTQLGSHSCTQCSPGTYSASPGSNKCTACSVGYFQDKLGQAVCKKCPAGEYSLNIRSKLCLKCPLNLPTLEEPTFIQCLEGKFDSLEAVVESADQQIINETSQQFGKIKEDNGELKKADTEMDTELKRLKEENEEMSKIDTEMGTELKRLKEENNEMYKADSKMGEELKHLKEAETEMSAEMKRLKEEFNKTQAL